MSNSPEREESWTLIVNAVDNLEQIVRARELTNSIWDINSNRVKTEQDWLRTAVLLESYEKIRDEALEAALSSLRDYMCITAK